VNAHGDIEGFVYCSTEFLGFILEWRLMDLSHLTAIILGPLRALEALLVFHSSDSSKYAWRYLRICVG